MAHPQTPEDIKEYACIWNFWTVAPRGDGGENGLSSGTSGPIASSDDGAIFLAAAKTYKGSVRRGFLLTLGRFLLRTLDMILVQHRVRRMNRRKECAEHAALIPVRRATNTIRPREHGHTRANAATRPHPRAHTRGRSRAHARPGTTTTFSCWDF